MAGKKYLQQVGGKLKEKSAIDTSAGASSAGEIPALDNTGRLNANMMPVGIAPTVKDIVASETIVAGAFVNIYDNGGVLNVRNADASNPAKQSDGFVLEAYVATDVAKVFVEDFNNQKSGMTLGKEQFLSATTPGATTETAPTTAGHIVQLLGKAVSATEMTVEIGQTIELA